MDRIQDQGASADADRATAAEPEVSALRDGIPSAVIEQFCADVQAPLQGIVKKFCEQAYETILGDVEFYLRENAVFNIGSRFDAQQREVVTAYKALRAVEEALTLREAHANAYAARKGYWSEERAAEYRAEAIEALKGGDASCKGRHEPKCDCGKPATTTYEGDPMCEACATYCARRDFEESEMPGGFGE